MKHIDCLTCGFPNPINQDSCEFCGASLREALLKDPELILCATCSGTGLVHLDYTGNHEEDPENQCLPCADCGGTGRRSLPDMRAAAMKRGSIGILDTVLGLLEAILGR